MRGLLCLSLRANEISDGGASALAEVLDPRRAAEAGQRFAEAAAAAAEARALAKKNRRAKGKKKKAKKKKKKNKKMSKKERKAAEKAAAARVDDLNKRREAGSAASTLVELDLSYNDLCAQGGTAIAEMLMGNKSITALHLAGNAIGDEGALRFAHRTLVTNRQLTALDIDWNGITDVGTAAIARSIAAPKLPPEAPGTTALDKPLGMSGWLRITVERANDLKKVRPKIPSVRCH